MEIYWTCSECGSANLYPDITECEVCGKEIDDTEIKNAKATIKKIEDEIAKEKRREFFDFNTRRDDIEKKLQLLKEKIQNTLDKENLKTVLDKDKLKDTLKRLKTETGHKSKAEILHSCKSIVNYIGIIASIIMALIILVRTLIMNYFGVISAGWVFFLILAIASVVLSFFGYLFFNDNFSRGFANLIPSGIIGAFAIASTISNLWADIILRLFQQGFLVILFAGLIVLAIFLFLVALSTVIILAVTLLLPAYLQTMLGDTKGGLIGLLISFATAFLYLTFIQSDGVAIILG